MVTNAPSSVTRYNVQDPKNASNDRFILSKGHAAPILYAAWAEAGLFPLEDLVRLSQSSYAHALGATPLTYIPKPYHPIGLCSAKLCQTLDTAIIGLWFYSIRTLMTSLYRILLVFKVSTTLGASVKYLGLS